MSRNPRTAFEKEPVVMPLQFFDRPGGRAVSVVLVIVLFGGLLGGLSCLMSRRRMPPPNPVVVAAHDLRPYQRLEAADIETAHVDQAVDGTVMTGTTQLLNRSIVLRDVDTGQAVTAESVVIFPSTVTLTDTVLLTFPLSRVQATHSSLEPGSTMLVIGVSMSDTVPSSVYSVTIPLVDVTDTEVVFAASPGIAAQLSSYFTRGQMVLAPNVDH